MEKRPMLARSNAHKDLLESKIVDDEDEEESLLDEEEGDEEEGEEGEDEEAAEEEAGGEEVVEEETWPPKDRIKHIDMEDKYFIHGENLRNKFSEVELDSFMKLLNVKPYKQWEDKSTHHYKLGTHAYEDDSQELDPAFHILGEVERKY
jgi:hypothetical protein